MEPPHPLAPDLTILAAMLTPVVLVSACGTLLLSTANRLARVADRVETWSDELAATAGKPPDTPLARDRRALIVAQLGMMAWRAQLLQGAMTALYEAVAVFVADMVAIGIVAFVRLGGSWLPIALALLGGGLPLAGSVLLIAEARHALVMTKQELAFVRRHAEPPDATGTPRELSSASPGERSPSS
jgi:hypothetical protein